jgi:hypothetical protein
MQPIARISSTKFNRKDGFTLGVNKYTLITAYIPKGIHVFGPQLRQILALKNNEFNIGDIKELRHAFAP